MNANSSTESIIAEAVNARASGQISEAIAMLKEAVKADPKSATAFFELGLSRYRAGKLTGAITAFQKSLALNPTSKATLVNLGVCYNESGQNTKAIDCYEKALAIDPNIASAWSNLAKAWHDDNEHETSIYCYRKALTLKSSPQVIRGLALAYRKSGRYDRSQQLLDGLLQENPNDARAHFGLAMSHLYRENYSAALPHFEWRAQLDKQVAFQKDYPQIFSKPAYNGEDLAGKTLLLYTEQGFGDNLQYARFINLLEGKAGKIVIWCRKGLGRLFSHCFKSATVSEDADKLPAFDYQLSLMSLPFFFDNTLSSLEKFSPYLSAIPSDKPLFKKIPRKLNIGLVWGAEQMGYEYGNKKVPLELLAPLIATANTAWFSLQLGADKRDLETFSQADNIVDLSGKISDFSDTANAMEQLDLIISCDTSVAHLAGAMGKPLWVMLNSHPDWRWHSDNNQGRWYPSSRLYLQKSTGDWRNVVKGMHRDLTSSVAKDFVASTTPKKTRAKKT